MNGDADLVSLSPQRADNSSAATVNGNRDLRSVKRSYLRRRNRMINMRDEHDARVGRIEKMVFGLIYSLNPQMTIGDIRRFLGLKDRVAVYEWLNEHHLKPATKWHYRRVEVIEAWNQN